MTIRYQCTGCDSILKIKDEKAGTKGKCPKCKAEFLVPQPEDLEEGIEVDTEAETESADASADLVDMPIELTPEVEESSEFDPASALGGPARPGSAQPTSAASGAGTPDRKPSVAELMKDFEATKKKDREKKAAQEAARQVSAAATAEASGTAADALTRAYQQKRESASAAPPMSAKEAKAAEERTLLVDFIKFKAAPAVVLLVGFIYAWLWWMNYEPHVGPPLFEVTGIVSKGGAPAEGVRISFEPILSGPTDLRGVSSGITGKNGTFRLMYNASFSGAPAGEYNIGLVDNSGIPISHPDGALKLTVTESGPNDFKIDL